MDVMFEFRLNYDEQRNSSNIMSGQITQGGLANRRFRGQQQRALYICFKTSNSEQLFKIKASPGIDSHFRKLSSYRIK